MAGLPPPEHVSSRHLVADIVFAVMQQTGVAGTIATIWVLAPTLGEERAILVGLLVGLATALSAALTRQAVRGNGRPPAQGNHRSDGRDRAY